MLYDIEDVHLELSSYCNARCPFCPRNLYGMDKNFGYTETNLSLEDFERIFSIDVLSKIKDIQVNGNFGDFMMNHQSPDILEHVLSINPKIRIFVDTNGSAQTQKFWERLGKLGITIYFGIDGIKGTSELYRQDTDFDRVIRNAQTFISAGGTAIWKLIEFDHNKAEIPEIENLAQELGFSSMVVINGQGRTFGPVYDRKGKKIFVIQEEDELWPEQLDDQFIQEQVNYIGYGRTQPNRDLVIQCEAVERKSVYVASDGHVYPCCWTGHNPQSFRPTSSYHHWNKELTGLISHNHAPSVGLEKAMAWFEQLAESWPTDRRPGVCQTMCGKKEIVNDIN